MELLGPFEVVMFMSRFFHETLPTEDMLRKRTIVLCVNVVLYVLFVVLLRNLLVIFYRYVAKTLKYML